MFGLGDQEKIGVKTWVKQICTLVKIQVANTRVLMVPSQAPLCGLNFCRQAFLPHPSGFQ